MSWWDNLQDGFSQRMREFVAASGGRLSIISAYRSVEEQTYLWEQALADYGSEDEARRWVAPPGKSNHNHGLAVDLGYETDDAMEWAHKNAYKYGLHYPMEWEPWHIEPVGSRDGLWPKSGDSMAYTRAPHGYLEVNDPSRRANVGYHLELLNHFLLGIPGQSNLGGPADTEQNLLGEPNERSLAQSQVISQIGAEPSNTTRRGDNNGFA